MEREREGAATAAELFSRGISGRRGGVAAGACPTVAVAVAQRASGGAPAFQTFSLSRGASLCTPEQGCDGGVVLIAGALHISHLHAAVEQFMGIGGSYWSRRTRSSASCTTAPLPLDWLHVIERPTENLTARNVNLVSRNITNVASQFAIPVTTGHTINCRSQAMQARQ